MENNNLNEDQIKEIRRKRLQQLGYPMPMEKPTIAPVVNVKDQNMLARINQIRQGQFKSEFNEFRSKSGEAQKAPLKRQNEVHRGQQQQPKSESSNPKVAPPPLQEFSAKRNSDLDALSGIFGESSTQTMTSPTGRVHLQNPAEIQNPSPDAGKAFIDNFRQKFHSNMQQKQQAQTQPANANSSQIQYTNQQEQLSGGQLPLQSGLIVINEEDLKKKIINISKQVAKQVSEQMIKSVLLEYTKMQQKSTIVENEKIKKAEIVADGMVKIDGKLYKLNPVTVKKTNE